MVSGLIGSLVRQFPSSVLRDPAGYARELADMHHSWEAIVAQAARNTELYAGDVLGSGTVGTGCIFEHGDGRWLQPGDVVELEIEGIGVLRNRVGAKP